MEAKKENVLQTNRLSYELIRTFTDNSDSVKTGISGKEVNFVNYSPDKKYVVCGYRDGYVVIFDYKTAEIIKKFKAHQGKVMHVEFDAANDLMCTAGADSKINILDYKNFCFKEEVIHPSFHGRMLYEIRFVLFSHDKKQIYFGADSGCLFVYPLNSQNKPVVLVSPDDMYPREPYFLTSGILSPDKKQLVFASGYSLKFVNLSTGKVDKIMGSTTHYINDVVFFPGNDDILATWSENGIITFWDNKANTPLTSFIAGDSDYSHISFSGNAKYLASANCGNKIRIWDAFTKHLLAEIETKFSFDESATAHSAPVKSLVFVDNSHLLTGSLDGTAKLWRLKS